MAIKISNQNLDLNTSINNTLVIILDNKNKISKQTSEYLNCIYKDKDQNKNINNFINLFIKNTDFKKNAKYHILSLAHLNNKNNLILIKNNNKNSNSPKLKTLFQENLYQNILSGLKQLSSKYNNSNIYINLSELINTNNKSSNKNTDKNNIHSHLNACAELEHELNYKFTKYLSENLSNKNFKKNNIKINIILNSELKKLEKSIKNEILQLNHINNSISFCRDLANTPPNDCNPVYLAKQANNLAKENKNFTCKIIEETALKKMGMNCLVAVGQGSETPSKLIICKYTHPDCKKDDPIVLVGKGVTFDTGGLSLKSPKNMVNMHHDMCGAASVLSAIKASAELNLKVNLVVLVPTAENMPDSKSYRPSDIIKSYDGKTVEITNTDAEGRLILCDALTYADKTYSPKSMIDLATLTGAIIVALGHKYHGVFSNNDKLAEKLIKAGVNSQDLAWQMPLPPDYIEPLTSKMADMKNCGDGVAGSTSAAQYLASFVGECKNWAHIDIAGTAMGINGGTGRSIRLLLQYLLDQEKT